MVVLRLLNELFFVVIFPMSLRLKTQDVSLFCIIDLLILLNKHRRRIYFYTSVNFRRVLELFDSFYLNIFLTAFHSTITFYAIIASTLHCSSVVPGNPLPAESEMSFPLRLTQSKASFFLSMKLFELQVIS